MRHSRYHHPNQQVSESSVAYPECIMWMYTYVYISTYFNIITIIIISSSSSSIAVTTVIIIVTIVVIINIIINKSFIITYY